MMITDWSTLPVSADDGVLAFQDVNAADVAQVATLDEILAILRSPDDAAILQSAPHRFSSVASGELFAMSGARPVLLPRYARDALKNGPLQLSSVDVATPGLQYLLLGSIKMRGGPQNSDYDDIWFKRHVHRARKLLAGASGLTLDIGCDRPSISRCLYPLTVKFLGIEPSPGASDEFCICGMGEHLPIADAEIDNVVFMTSLDHILDYHTAIDEARRVLKPGGMLYLASLVWTERASLIGDTVHFHHFRDFELQGALRGLSIESITRYNWKNDTHRYGIYLAARKPG